MTASASIPGPRASERAGLRPLALITTMAGALGLSTASWAEDIDAYVAEAGVGAPPNVLIILDTSASMDAKTRLSQPYDGARHYPAPGQAGACNEDRYLFFSTGSGDVPECDSPRRFERSRLKCDDAIDALYGRDGLYAYGFYSTRFGARDHDEDRYTNSGFELAATGDIECREKAVDGGVTWRGWKTYTLYGANYLRWYRFNEDRTIARRIEVVQDAVKRVAGTSSGINLALMRFDDRKDSNGGYVIAPFVPIDDRRSRARINRAVDGLSATGLTPLAETLYEAYLLFSGGKPRYGKPWSMDSGLRSEIFAKGRYRTPVVGACAASHIVILSDGLPTADSDADNAINTLLEIGNKTGERKRCSGKTDDSCLDDLAGYLHGERSADAAPGGDAPPELKVTVHAVGFELDHDTLLRQTASRGGGNYYGVDDADSLTRAFTSAFESILAKRATFVAPALAVNAFNRLEHRDGIYLAMFSPTNRVFWPGNVKKYGIGTRIDDDGQPAPVLVDADGKPAVDPKTGLIRSTARSLWTLAGFSADGGNPGKGGLASRLFDYTAADSQYDPRSREHAVFTYTAAPGAERPFTDLTDPANALHEDNAFVPGKNETGKITAKMLNQPGIDGDTLRELLRWARGVDVADEDRDGRRDDARASMGAPLHSAPMVVTYRAAGGTQSDYLFVTTNDGFLHMASVDDTGDGRRLPGWSFMPPDQLANIETLFRNEAAEGISYGLDGGMDVWLNDADGDGGVLDAGNNPQSGEHVYLYFGQRRGGSRYYAVDVTDPNRPKYLWSVAGGVDSEPDSPLKRLGQTWSRPRHTAIYEYDNAGQSLVRRDVIIAGGGYDVGQDQPGSRHTDNVGNAVYILDAGTGDVLWWAGGSTRSDEARPDLVLDQMNYSIPADIRLIDLNADGVTDRFYTADTGGQVWRFDIENDVPGQLSERITGGRIAELQSAPAGAPGARDNRRFYYPPDVALARPADGQPFLAVAIGSGFRAEPNDTGIRDRLYLIKDYAIDGPPGPGDEIAYISRRERDLLDVTHRLEFDGLDPADRELLANGWFVQLEERGEKVLSPALTVDGTVLVTTYIPADPNAAGAEAACGPQAGRSRVYAVSAVDGRPTADLDGSDSSGEQPFTLADRFHELKRGGIAPAPTVLFSGEGDKPLTTLVGTEFVPELRFGNPPEPTYWLQRNVH